MRLWFVCILLAGCAAAPAPETPVEPVYTPEPVKDAWSLDLERLNLTTVTERYVGHMIGPFGLNTGCDGPGWNPGGPENIGAACFDVPPDTQYLEFDIVDDVVPVMGGYFRTSTQSGFFCDGHALQPTNGTTWLVVGAFPFTCNLQQQASSPTMGDITVDFYHGNMTA